MKVGDTAYIVESNRYVREVEIRRCSGGMFLELLFGQFMKKSPCINLFSHTYYAGMPKIAVKIKKSSPKSIVAKRNEKNIIA